MCRVAVDIPEEVLFDIKMSEADAGAFARQLVAIGLYVQKKVSLGYAAQVAEMQKADFMRLLGENQISIFRFDNEEEFLEEMSNA